MRPQERFLRELFDVAVAASSAGECVAHALPKPPRGRTVVFGAGKAAASMARVVEDNWNGPLEGLVVTPYRHGLVTRKIEVVEASHPLPDQAGHDAAARILKLASGLGEDDLALCLISGGGSSLLAMPVEPVTLDEKQDLNRTLLRCGATITEINTVRKHLSAIKGGRLAEACHPAQVVTLAISDVPGDDPSTIASGPTVADPTTAREAIDVLAKYSVAPSATIMRYLRSMIDTPLRIDPRAFSRDSFRIVARARTALEGAQAFAQAAGWQALILSDQIEGESREVGKEMAEIVEKIRSTGQPLTPPCVVLSGGETTVTVAGNGRGGRNTELLLALSLALEGRGQDKVWALAADTDGIDGVGDNAGAVMSPDTMSRARQLGLEPEAALADNDAYAVFARIGDLVVTGPTRTNVNDFRAILIQG